MGLTEIWIMHSIHKHKRLLTSLNWRIARRRVAFAACVCIGCLQGCVKQTRPVGQVDKSPLVIDDAMVQRPWSRSTARFQNGETPAGPTGSVLTHAPDAPAWTPVLTDTPLFMANILVMPVGYLFTPPWTRVIYPTDVAEPSYTAIPPIPPKRQ